MAKSKKRARGRTGLSAAQARKVRAEIRALIRERGGTTAAADALGITPSAVSQIDNEKNAPSIATVIAVARERGVTVASLLGEP